MEGGDQPSLPVDIAEFDGAPQAEGFDLDPHPGEVADILGEIGAARKPRCGSATTSPSDVSRESASRIAPRLTESWVQRS